MQIERKVRMYEKLNRYITTQNKLSSLHKELIREEIENARLTNSIEKEINKLIGDLVLKKFETHLIPDKNGYSFMIVEECDSEDVAYLKCKMSDLKGTTNSEILAIIKPNRDHAIRVLEAFKNIAKMLKLVLIFNPTENSIIRNI